MSEKMAYTYNHTSGVEEIRPLTEKELEEYAQGAIAKAQRENEAAEVAARKESARAKLLALGLDLAEIEALLGKEPEPIER